MRSDRDKRSDSEREIDDFLSRFEDPAGDLSSDYSSYFNDSDTTKATAAQTFSWMEVESPDFRSLKKGADPDPKAVSESDKTHEPEAKAEAEPVSEPETVTEEEPVPEPEPEAEPEVTKSETEAEAEPKPEAGLKTEADPPAPAASKPAKKKKKKKTAGKSKKKTAAAVSTAAKKAKSIDKKKLRHTLFYKKNKDYDPSQGPTYKKGGKTVRNTKYKFSFLKLLGDMVAVGMVFVMAGLIYALAIITVAPKYDYKDIYAVVDTASVVYNDEGQQIDNIFYTENRKIVKYEDMPEDLINSFVAIEDKTFWKHHGFNWTRMIGAVLSSFTGSGRISGTSTITQQLARNVYLADTKSVRSIKRKILEMYYASRLERFLSKEEIIEAYLNTIYLGHGCYGVNAAAKTYFSKSVKDLDLIECASLAALPQSPDTYALLKLASEAQNVVDSEVVATEPDTVVTNDLAKNRRQLALDLMLAQNYIDQSEHDEVYDESLNDFIKPNLKSSSSIYSYFHEYLVDTIISDLMDQYGMEYEDAERLVYTGGLQIYSTVDSTAMEVIAKEFQDGSNFPYVSAPRDGNGNMLNNDGQIALYKYSNYFDKEGDFRLSGADGDVKVNDDGSITIMKGHKLHIYETEVDGQTDYSLEFKTYFFYDEDDICYSISGGYLNVPMGYKEADSEGNVIISKDFFEDPYYEGAIKIDGNDVVLTRKSYTLSPRQRQPQAAMTIVGVGTGEVKAMVGGRQFGGQKVLNRSLNPRQPGSSIKPLAVYGAALQKSYELAEAGQKWQFIDYHIDKQGTKGWGDYITTHSSIEDERTKIEGKYWPNNFNNSFSGKNTFKTAIQKSINTCAVKIILQVGNEYSIEQLKKFGLTTVQDDLSNPVNDANPAALGLGAMTQGVEPLEMALAYAAFPAGGKVNTPVCYTKVIDREGKVLLEGKSTQTEALNEGVAWIMQEVLKSVVTYNRYMSVSGFQPGGKTGTTNDQYDIWFDGFTPSYAGSIWIGTDENVEMSTMSTPAAALWGKIMTQLPKAKEGAYPAQPANVISKGGDYYTKGTETGLTSWSDKEAKEKAKKEAYKKWLAEREAHKVLIPEQGHYEDVYESVKIRDAWDEEVDDPNSPIYGDPDPITGERPIIGYNKKTVHHEAEYQNVKTGTRWVIDVPAHYEYSPGWRDGDFNYKGN